MRAMCSSALDHDILKQVFFFQSAKVNKINQIKAYRANILLVQGWTDNNGLCDVSTETTVVRRLKWAKIIETAFFAFERT